MTERCLSFDLEWSTQDLPNGVRVGDLACLQWCELLATGATTEPEVLAAWPGADDRAREVFADALLSRDWVVLGQNVAGDVLKAALHWGLLAEADAAYRQGRVRCTFLAQRLVDVAWPGRLSWVTTTPKRKRKRDAVDVDLDLVDDSQVEPGREGFWAIRKFRPDRLLGREVEFTTDDDEGGRGGAGARAGLDALAARYLGLDLRADKKGADSWRKRYGELIGTPVEHWPEEAVRYAREDPRLTALVRVEQHRRPMHPYDGPWADVAYPPRGSVPWAPFRCERFEAHAHFALADMERLGLQRDQPRVERMRETLRRAAAAAEGAAIRAGVVRLEVSCDAAAARAAGFTRLDVSHDAGAGKASGLSAAEVREAFRAAREAAEAGRRDEVLALAAAHPWLQVAERRDTAALKPVVAEARALADQRDPDALAAFAAERPWIVVDRVKDQGEVLSRAVALYLAAGMRELPKTKSGNTSAEAEHLQQVVRPRADAPEAAAADLRELVGPDLLAHLQAWTDAGQTGRIEAAIAAANDPGLAAHMVKQKCSTFDGAFLKVFDERHRATDANKWSDPWGPARSTYSPFKATGRTGMRGDIRNPPKSGGVRECLVPRPGRVLVTVDWAAGEMSTLADVLDELVLGGRGWSTLGQAIRAGDDCHLRLAAVMRREPYEQLVAFYKPLKKRIEAGEGLPASLLREWRSVDLDRAGAKEGNFGYAGGMGPRKFARLQRKKGRDCDEARARFIRDAWLEAWSPEVPAYFDLATQATGGRGERKSATVVHMRGGHVRGGLDYCQWANTHFQQLLAAGAKRAAILLFGACRFDQSSPLYRVADPALFVHDEFILEVDEAHAEAGLAEVRRLMERGMSTVCRTPIKTEGKILRERWSK